MRVLIYARVSRTADNSTSIQRQLADGREHAARRWPAAPVLEFTDDGVSGTVDPDRRDGFGALMAQWQPGDIVLFWRLDRLARSLLGFADIMRSTQKASVMLVSVNDAFDLTTPDGRMQANIVATFAEWERELIRARVSATRRQLHKTGRWAGGRVPYGLKIAPHPSGEGKTLARDQDAAGVIREIVRRILEGEGITPIARDLQQRAIPSPRVHTSIKRNPKPSAWSSASVRDVLGHPNIVGHQKDPVTGRLVRENGRPVEIWEPVVSVDERDRAVAALPAQTGRAAPKDRHWLYSSVRCHDCAANMHLNRTDTKQAPVFKCYGTKLAPHPAVTVRVIDAEEHINSLVVEGVGGGLFYEREWVGGEDTAADLERLRDFLDELEEDRKAGLYADDDGKARFRRQYLDTKAEIAELEARPVTRSGWRYMATPDPISVVWGRWTPEQRGAWLRDAGAYLSVSRPAVKRARVPLADRSEMHWGDLLDMFVEIQGVAHAEETADRYADLDHVAPSP